MVESGPLLAADHHRSAHAAANASTLNQPGARRSLPGDRDHVHGLPVFCHDRELRRQCFCFDRGRRFESAQFGQRRGGFSHGRVLLLRPKRHGRRWNLAHHQRRHRRGVQRDGMEPYLGRRGSNRRGNQQLFCATELAEQHRDFGNHETGAGRRPRSRPKQRSLRHSERGGLAIRGNQFERSCLGGILRPNQSGARASLPFPNGRAQSPDLSAPRVGEFPGHHQRQQRRVRRRSGV